MALPTLDHVLALAPTAPLSSNHWDRFFVTLRQEIPLDRTCLWLFLDRNTGRILRMGHKRYISTEYQAARRLAASSVAHPNLRATVEPIVAFLRREGLVPQPPAE
jgi:hypothetical protein